MQLICTQISRDVTDMALASSLHFQGWTSPPRFLDSDASNRFVLQAPNAPTIKAPTPLKCWRRTHIHHVKSMCSLVPIFFWLFGGQYSPVSKHCCSLLLILAKMTFVSTMYTSVHLTIHISMWVLCLVHMLGACLWCIFSLGFYLETQNQSSSYQKHISSKSHSKYLLSF